jgi:hypothetical protein
MVRTKEGVKQESDYLQGALIHWLEGGPYDLSYVRLVFRGSTFNDAFDPASSERRFLTALEQLEKDGDVTIEGVIPCDQAMIRLNVRKS